MLPKGDFTPFNGDPRNWPQFIASFRDLVHDVVPSTAKRLSLLRQLLTPTVRESIAHSLHNPALYQQALLDLEKMFGHPQMVSQAYIQGLLDMKPAKENDLAVLRAFQLKLHGAVGNLASFGYTEELHSTSTLTLIRRKLPESSGPMVPARVQATTTQCFVSRFRSMAGKHSDGKNDEDAAGFHRRDDVIIQLTETLYQARRKEDDDKGPIEEGTYHSRRNRRAQRTGMSLLQQSDHKVGDCKEFVDLSKEERVHFVKQKGLYFKCLKTNHRSAEYRSLLKCSSPGCLRGHHTLLHDAPGVFKRRGQGGGASSPAEAETTTMTPHVGTTSCPADVQTNTSVLLSIVPVVLRNGTKSLKTYALLDSGSEATLIRDDVATKLELKGLARTVRFGTFHGSDTLCKSTQVSLTVTSCDGNTVCAVPKAYTVQKITVSGRQLPRDLSNGWPHIVDLDIPSVEACEVTVLLGMDVPEVHEQLEVRRPPKNVNGPWGILTLFGWCLVGQVPVSTLEPEIRRVNVRVGSADDELHDLVTQFWRSDSFRVKPDVKAVLSRDEEKALDILKNTTQHLGDRYEAGLLWKEPDVCLPDNYYYATKRFQAVERRLLEDQRLAKQYAGVIQEYIDLGHAPELDETVAASAQPGRIWYLPHHGVRHPAKPDKLQVVFDASAKYRGISLNAALLKGPDLLGNLAGLLIRFRERPIPISSDVAKMFHQVRVREQDRGVLRFLWREPGSQQPFQVLQMQVQIFGAVSSPTTCIYVMQRTAADFNMDYAGVWEKVQRNFYVDNYVDSYETEDDAIRCCHQLRELLQRGGFRLTKWISASRKVLSSFQSQERMSPNLNLDFDDLPVERTLGVRWNAELDDIEFSFRVPDTVDTKRQTLRVLASIFDPLGLISPVVVAGKILLQEIWRSGVDWDDKLPPNILHKFKKWADSLLTLENFKVRRCFRATNATTKEIQLHVFTD